MISSLVFFGTEDFSAAILSRLIDARYDIKAVVTKPDTPRGRGRSRSAQAPAVKTIAEKYSIPVLQPGKLKEAADDIAYFDCQHAVLAAYGKIVPKSVLDSFHGGIINVHPSLLPRYRGPSPIESAILNGDAKTGASIMKLVEAMDAGPVYAQVDYPLNGAETRPELYGALGQIGADMLIKHLPAITSGQLTAQPQNDEQATYCSLIKKSDGVIDWHKSATRIERDIRAYLGWPGSRTELFGREVTILEAEISETTLAPGEIHATTQNPVLQGQSLQDNKIFYNKRLLIGTGEQSLHIKKLRPAGRSSMNANDFLRGLRVV